MTMGGVGTILNQTLTAANTQYAVSIAGARRVSFKCRTAAEVRYAFEDGKVATPTAPYMTLPANCQWSDDYMIENVSSLYLASSVAGVVVEVEKWV